MKLMKPMLAACMAFACLQLKAQFRKYSNEFLNIGAGARGLGMGGAQVASVQDGTAGYWNPAALVHIKEHPSLNTILPGWHCLLKTATVRWALVLCVLP
jgi:hypothetical protein